MRSKVLAAAVALGVAVLATAHPASAQSSDAAEIAQLKAQLAAMQAKIDELEQRTDAQSQINVSTQQNLEAMQQKQESQEKASDWASSTKVGGTAYIDFTNIDQTKNGSKTDASG